MMRCVASYAVLWQDGDGPRVTGRLEFDELGLCLYGNGGRSVRVGIPFDEILSVERDPSVRVGPCRAIRLTSRTAGSFLVASITGAGMLNDILRHVLDALPAPAL